jgi:hypothetical protein
VFTLKIIFFSRSSEPISIKFGTNHPWVKRIKDSSTEGSGWLRHRSQTKRPLTPAHVGSNPVRTDVTVWESLSVYLRKVGGLFTSALYNVSGFSLPPIITDCHRIIEKLLSMAKNSKQSINLFQGEIIIEILILGGIILKSSQEPLSQKNSYLHESFLI